MKLKIFLITLLLLIPLTQAADSINLDFNQVIGYAITAKNQGTGEATKQFTLNAITQADPNIGKAIGFVQNPQGAAIGYASDLALSELGNQNPELAEYYNKYTQLTQAMQNPSGALLGQLQQQQPGFAKAQSIFSLLSNSNVKGGSSTINTDSPQ